MMYKSTLPMIGLAIDVETTGSDWGKDSSIRFQAISFGVIAFNTRTFEEIDSFYMEIKFDSSKYEWTSSAEAIHGLSREYLEINGLEREDAAIKLAEFIFKYCGSGPIVMLAFNVEFDIGFTRQLLNDFDLPFNLHATRLDPGGTSFMCLGISKSDKVFEFFGYDKRNAHNALEDSRMALGVAREYHLIFAEIFK